MLMDRFTDYILKATSILYNTSTANLKQAAAHTRALIREESQMSVMSVGAVGRTDHPDHIAPWRMQPHSCKVSGAAGRGHV